MKIAVISDIHGNKTALEAVLKDIERREIERIFCLGDLIGKGPQGSECIKLIQDYCEKVIRGNWDVFILDSTDNEFLLWFQDRLTEEDKRYLSSLPFHIDLEANGQLIRFFHASPRSVFERILPTHSYEKRQSMFENSEALVGHKANRKPDIVMYGDIHSTYLDTYKNGILCNVGSVGNSLDLTTSSYVILDTSYGTNAIQFIRVDYDKKAELSIAEQMGMPGFDEYYGEIMFAKYRNPK